jgi:peptidyl-prolyl cis-trans isomerase SurA
MPIKTWFVPVLAALLAWLPPSIVPAAQPLDQIVAVVEEDVVLRSELDRALVQARGERRASGQPVPPQDAFEREVLEELILEKLQSAAAAKAGITVSDEEVDAAVASIAERNGITVAQLRQILGNSGMSYTGFRENIRKQILEANFQRQQLGGSIEVSEAEIDNYLEQNPVKTTSGKVVSQTRARHILVRTGERTSAQDARNRLESLRQRILNGEDFATLARANSDDTASALRGGELGWINPGDTTPDFERQLENLGINEISQPFKTPFGYHIVQVQERRQQDIADAAHRAEAASKIRERKAKEALQLLSRRLRDEAYVEIRLDNSRFD